MRSRILLFLATLILVPLLTYFVILFARGYRPSSVGGGSLQPTGILAASSLPEGAQLYINGQFKSATNTNLNLPPGLYEIEIKKDTYYSWKKTLEIKPEEVTRAVAVLFPTVPALKAITSAGAAGLVLSPDGTKVAFVSEANIYTLDLSESPLGLLNRDPKLIYTTSISPPSQRHDQRENLGGDRSGGISLNWSPDSKQILAISTPSAQLIDINNQQSTKLIASPSAILNQWNQTKTTREALKLSTLPLPLLNTLATAAANLVWSPKENKVLYTATASATIANNLIRQLPGSSTQLQSRQLEPGKIYVYDAEEDRNFAINITPLNPPLNLRGGNPALPAGGPQGEGDINFRLQWFPTSNHLVKLEQGKVTVLEYDGGNSTVIYAGPMENGYAFPYPSSRQLLILANLNSATSKAPNLYAVSLR